MTSSPNSLPAAGATVRADGVTYCTWAPAAAAVAVDVESPNGSGRRLLLERHETGYHYGLDEGGQAGDAYLYNLEGIGRFADPVSRAQRDSVEGRSLVVDPQLFGWSDGDWRRPAFRDLVIYELHVGTFTEAGTFRGAIERLDHVRRLGATAIEILPVADFPGTRNWGYDGVLIYAPARAYGAPDDFRALVNAAHERGLAVILDVVYNHFGPSGNHVLSFSPDYCRNDRQTPWGSAFNLDPAHCTPVRSFFLQNPLYWMDEFHIDGFRLDAAHEIFDSSEPHLLKEITAAVRDRGGYVTAEDDRNSSAMIRTDEEGGFGFHAVWADDFHHSARVGQTGEKFGYLGEFSGTVEETLDALGHGWIFRGQVSTRRGQARGSDASALPPERFIHCISNHDQVGNRAFGERIGQLVAPDAYRALSALICLTPYTPLLFMGQEWRASTPFLYFTDHEPDLGEKVTIGRRQEFADFPGFDDPAALTTIPDPQAEETFRQSKLNWAETENETLALYRECLALRGSRAAFRPTDRRGWSVQKQAGGAGLIDLGAIQLVFDLAGGRTGEFGDGRVILSTEESRFGGSDAITWQDGHVRFASKGLVVVERDGTVGGV
ncbi:MAG: malto-oligosyltrehalose trehalohydrolase [Terrimicrobiaceae bacterium]|nr:malto-oligosyltrehalose trehalohydrolase [Terrimicrobiaceae bacterium]